MESKNNEDYCKTNSHKDLVKSLPSNKSLENNAEILKALADPTRLKIIYMLKNGELCVCEILDAIDKSQSTISHHLNLMKKQGVLQTRKEGTWSYYKLANVNIIETIEKLIGVVE